MAQHLRPSKNKKEKIGWKEGWKRWINSWRWSSIKKEYQKEYSRVRGNSQYIFNKIDEKLR